MAGAKEEYDEIQGIKRKAREELAETSSAAKTARELAGSAGAAEFTAGFREAKELAGAGSLVWLWASGISVALALLSAAVLMYLEVSGILKSPTCTHRCDHPHRMAYGYSRRAWVGCQLVRRQL